MQKNRLKVIKISIWYYVMILLSLRKGTESLKYGGSLSSKKEKRRYPVREYYPKSAENNTCPLGD